MKHTEVVAALSEQLEMSRSEVTKILAHIAVVFRKLLDNDTSLTLPDLGTFQVAERAKRKGYNPSRAQHMIIPPKRVLTYHPSQDLKDAMKEKKRMR